MQRRTDAKVMGILGRKYYMSLKGE